jgi:spore germination protein YaaH
LVRWVDGKRSKYVVTFVVIPLLIIATLLLPPISAATRIADLGTSPIGEAGGAIADPDGTQVVFLPGTVTEPFRASVSSIPRVSFLEGSAGQDLLEAAKSIPPDLVARSPFYQLELHGEAPSQSTWVMPIPNDSEPYDTLDVYAWESQSQSWQWLPHNIIREDDLIESTSNALPLSAMVMQTNPRPALVATDVAQAKDMPAESMGAVAQVAPTGLYLGGNGAIDGAVDATFDQAAGAYAVMPVIRNYEGPIVRSDLLANMLVDSNQRQTHIDNLVNLAVGNLYKGVDIDYRGLDKNLRGEFNQFVKELAEKLHAQGKELSVRVEPAVQVAEDRWETGPYDWQTLGLLADTVKVPAPQDPNAYIPDGQLDALVRYAVGQINRSKLQIALAGRSMEQAGNYLLPKGYVDALQPLLGRVAADQTVVEPGQPLNLALVSSKPTSGLVYDPNIGTYVYRYQDDQGNARTVWLENAASLSHKLDILKKYNLQGFTLENLPADGLDTDLWSLMKNYQQGRVQPIENNFVVEWTVKGSDGQTTSETRPLADSKVAFAAPNVAGALQVEAIIKDRGQIIARQSGDPIAVATYTPVPTPTPMPTPTPDFVEVTAKSNANVRSGPDTAYGKVGTLNAGATYRVTGQSETPGWWQISFDGKSAWVSADVVDVNGPTETVAMVQVAPPPTAVPVAAKPAAPKPAAAAAPAAKSYPAAPGSFGYGVQIDPWGNRPAAIAAIKNMGFNWVKIQVPWKTFEGSPGQRSYADDIINELAGSGLNVLASIVKAPDWARPGNTDRSVEGPPADPQTYADYVGAFAAHNKGKVKAIEVWNEQNLWYEWGHEPLNAGRYVDLLCRAYRAIKAADPGMSVLAGAPTPTGVNDGSTAIDDVAYLQQMYAAGAKNCFDGVGAHPSGYNNPPDAKFGYNNPAEPSFKNHPSFFFRDTMERYRGIMVANGDAGKRVWPTEFGWASTGSPHPGYEYATQNTEQEQADYIVRAFQMAKSWGWVGPMFLWNLDYNATQPSTELAAFGITGRAAQGALGGMPK